MAPYIVKNEELNDYINSVVICSRHPKYLKMITKFYIDKDGLKSTTNFEVSKMKEIAHERVEVVIFNSSSIQLALDEYNNIY